MLQFSGVIGVLFAGTLSDKIGRRKTLIIASTTLPLLFISFIFSNEYLMFPLLILLGFSLFSPGPVYLATVHDLNTKKQSFVNGFYMTMSFVIGSSFAFFIGNMADILDLETTYIIAAVLSLGSIPFAFMIKKRTHGQD